MRCPINSLVVTNCLTVADSSPAKRAMSEQCEGRHLSDNQLESAGTGWKQGGVLYSTQMVTVESVE